MSNGDSVNKPQRSTSRGPLHSSVVDKLDPAFVKLYNDFICDAPPSPTDLSAARQEYSTLYSYATAPATGVGGIGEASIPGWTAYPGDVRVRVYVPPGEDPGTRKVWPVHFNFHGGGWAVGDLETSAHICHHICATVPCCVIDVEYRLVPEYPFPVGIMDGLSAVAYSLANHSTFSIDPNKFTMGGESSGATIALILNHLLRDAGYRDRLKGVIVGTPVISEIKGHALAEHSPWASVREWEHAPIMNWQKLKWFDTFKWLAPVEQSSSAENGVYKSSSSKDEKPKDTSWFVDAMDAPNFDGLAPITWIGTAEIDPSRDEAEAYAKKCQDHGNHVIVKRFKGMPHSFMHMDNALTQGREYVEDVIEHVRESMYYHQRKGETTIAVSTTVQSNK